MRRIPQFQHRSDLHQNTAHRSFLLPATHALMEIPRGFLKQMMMTFFPWITPFIWTEAKKVKKTFVSEQKRLKLWVLLSEARAQSFPLVFAFRKLKEIPRFYLLLSFLFFDDAEFALFLVLLFLLSSFSVLSFLKIILFVP